MTDEVVSIVAMRSLKKIWSLYNRRIRSDTQNLMWLQGYQDILRDAGVSRFVMLRILKAEV